MRIVGGEARLEAWWETASPEHCSAAADALLSIADGTWQLHYDFYEEVTQEDTWVIIAATGLSIVVKFWPDLDGFQLIDIGRDV